MKKVEISRWLVSALLLLFLSVPMAAAAAEGVIAEVENHGDALVFVPVVEFHELILTVTGPCGFEYRQVVDEGEPIFRLDETTIDGAYRYNLFRTEEVDPGIVKILKEARASFDEEIPKQLCRDGKLPGPPLVQSAGFHVSRGEIIYDPGSVEKSLRGDSDVSMEELLAMKPDLGAPGEGSRLPTKDIVHNDDVIIDGSLCVGFDCVNGEVFGFDTIRLKENNLRIKFDDTSTAASFPRNDWQLTANDSANGGASKFSIDDISNARTPFTVEANARSHSLYVDDGGRIGNRTSTPSVEIHTIDGDTPTLRLQQDGSSGFAPQTWDVAGNETNFFVRDVTNGSTLPFRIRPGAPSSSIFIDVDGDVGFGTSSPAEAVEIETSADNTARLRFDDGNNWNVGGGAGNTFVIFDPADAAEFQINGAGDVTITGGLVTTGGGGACTVGDPCDGVFHPDFEIPTIEEHAAFMWENSYLPAVGPTPENGPINVTRKLGGILNELEKAHIYIEQLHGSMSEQRETLTSQQELIRQLEARLAALETGN